MKHTATTSPAAPSARQRHEAANREVYAQHLAAIEALLPLMSLNGCKPSVEGDRLVFRGPSGEHSLDILVSGPDRVLAHWEGFVGAPWAVIRKPGREDRHYDCTECGTYLPKTNHMVATDFGDFCCGACADLYRATMDEADAE